MFATCVWSESRTNDQTESRSAFAAACRRSLTSASSRAARSMRSCCICARACWLSTSSCWLSARACWRSARSVIALRSFAISSTVRVSSANWPATLAMSSRVVTFCRILLRESYAASGPARDRGGSLRQPSQHRRVSVKLTHERANRGWLENGAQQNGHDHYDEHEADDPGRVAVVFDDPESSTAHDSCAGMVCVTMRFGVGPAGLARVACARTSSCQTAAYARSRSHGMSRAPT